MRNITFTLLTILNTVQWQKSFTSLCGYHHFSPPERFHLPKPKPRTRWTLTHCCHPRQLPTPGGHLPLLVSVRGTTPGAPRKWSHTVFVILRLAYFTQHNVLRVHPCCSLWRVAFLRLNSKHSFVWMHHIFLIHSFTDRHLSCFGLS